MKRLIILFVLSLTILSSCKVNPSKINEGQGKKFVKSITYIYDARTGICYALVASRKTGEMDQSGIGLTIVPYEKVKAVVPVIVVR